MIFGVFMLMALCYLFTRIYRTRKLLEVFEMYSPQNVDDLELEISTTPNKSCEATGDNVAS